MARAIRFTMGAFSLCIDSTAVLIGCGVGFSLGLFGGHSSGDSRVANAHRRWFERVLIIRFVLRAKLIVHLAELN